jgi:hypothetical protein
MNKLLIIIFCIIGLNLKAQTLHFVVFGDTEDTRIGIPTKITCDYIKELSTEISTNAELKENYIKFTGQNFTKINLQNTLTNLSISPKDVVFAYIISHGWNNMKTEYPMMVFGPKSLGIDGGSVNLQEIYKSLSDKNPRLLIVFGEACNRDRESRPPAKKGGGAVMPPRFDIDPEQFRNLFRRSTKSIILCSSKRGQVSTSDMDKGGWFTQSFREVFEEMTSKNYTKEATWETLLEKTKKLTEKLAYDSGSDDPQSPNFEIKNSTISTVLPPTKPSQNTLTNQTTTPSVAVVTPPKTTINEPCKYNTTPYRVNEEKLRYLERYWKGLNEISNDEAVELFRGVYSKETKTFYETLSTNLNLEGFDSHTTWFKKKGKEVVEVFEEANEYLETRDFKMKALSKMPLVLESMKDITRRLDDIRRKCSE